MNEHEEFYQGADAYEQGDYATALRAWRPLAGQGRAEAQFNLGIMYGNGEGVPQDYVQAHMWLNLAAAQGHEGAGDTRDKAAKSMTADQIAEAQHLAREWRPE